MNFYSSQVLYQEFDGMHEDLIECITSLIFEQSGLTDIVLKLCEISTQEEQHIFQRRIIEGKELNLRPVDLAVKKFFSLDASSDILNFYQEMCKAKANKEQPANGLGIVRANSTSAKAKLKPLVLEDYDDEVDAPADAGSTSYKNQ